MTVVLEELPRRTLRKRREREQRVASILGAAETLFARQGYQQTSVEEIADLAEVSTGSIYFYFKNKEDLLIKAMDDCGQLLRNFLGDSLKASGFSFEDFSRVGQRFLLDFCMRYPEKTTILFRETIGQSTLVEEKRKLLFEMVADDIKRGLERVGDRDGKTLIHRQIAELAGVLVVGIYVQVAYHYLIWQDRSGDIEEISEQTVSFLLAGIGALLASAHQKPKRKAVRQKK